jgi:phthalate 4,5-cis-dihydrodiol dehydrogenase
LYDNEGTHNIDLGIDRAMGPGFRRAELEELYDAVVDGKPIFHTGAWGVATLEVVLGIIQSGSEHREIEMHHQVPVHERYGEARNFSSAI